MQLDGYAGPTSIEEAYRLYQQEQGSVLLGGCTFLNRIGKAAGTGIDLSGLGLDVISQTKDTLKIGAGVTFSQLERECGAHFGGVLKKALPALGAPLKNIITVGGTIGARLGMSDLLTLLLALRAEAVLHANGTMPLESYLASPPKRDIITAVHVPLFVTRAAFTSFRNASSAPPILHVAVGEVHGTLAVAVGARPGVAKLSPKAAAYMLGGGTAREAGRAAAMELEFKNDMNASGEYRALLCETLVERTLQEAGL